MNVVSIEEFQFSKKELKQTRVAGSDVSFINEGSLAAAVGIYPCFRFCLPKPGHTTDLT